ncbi:hypothetical protein EJ05DRAFT_536719 [Pseudovirgaria hyperparasitica]|uniref:TauD/TfdA-like domain-containing protein n=1 Tax=Pseudovirgaria hyperparasitica TaxID=470096 RepID=A0A6A6WF46_9PEZI|nr:uncharacterized protein EJ05DRAFT_536719 [Pseudovirgaria hyperparasitica]KAF2760654.1 hypothetical protein EJ05DRAFT_536719 [Pseudovirgaria hyperparasitica]
MYSANMFAMPSSLLTRTPSLESISSFRSSETTISEISGFAPASISPRVWDGSTLTPEDYVFKLSKEEVQAVRHAVVSFKLSGRPRSDLSPSTFHLPLELARKLRNCSEHIHDGPGLSVVRGLNEARFNDEESVLAFVGVSSHVCPERATDGFANQTLSHIRDATRDKVLEGAEHIGLAGSKLPTAMEFHADRYSGDVLALYVRNTGGENNGGDQFLASFGAVYNEILATDPEVLDTLSVDNWPFEMKDSKTELPYLEPGPVLWFSRGRPICQLVRAPLLGSPKIPRSCAMPKLSEKQLYALQVVEKIASHRKIKLDRQEGDIQYIHNLSVMHARSAYGSKAEGPSQRHLLRMFLRDPQRAWVKPPGYCQKFEGCFTKDREQNIPIFDADPWRKISGRDSHG